MTSTNEQAFVTACAQLIRSTVLAPIAQHLSANGRETSVEELEGILSLPAKPQMNGLTFPRPATAGIPSIAATSTAVPRVASGSKSKKDGARALEHTEGACSYILIRGANKGYYCNNVCAPGATFCAQHLKVKGATKPPAPVAVPGITAPAVAQQFPPPSPAANQNSLTCQEVGLYGAVTLLKSMEQNFAITNTSTGPKVLGVFESEQKIVPLVPATRALMISGLTEMAPLEAYQLLQSSNCDLDISALNVPTSQAPTVPQIPQASAVPQIPQASAVPQVPQVPQIPQIPQIPGM